MKHRQIIKLVFRIIYRVLKKQDNTKLGFITLTLLDGRKIPINVRSILLCDTYLDDDELRTETNVMLLDIKTYYLVRETDREIHERILTLNIDNKCTF